MDEKSHTVDKATCQVLSPPWASRKDWFELETAFHFHTTRYRSGLDSLTRIAWCIKRNLASLSVSFDRLCSMTCYRCPDPCCLTASVWYDFKDLLFIYLIQGSLPPHQAIRVGRSRCRVYPSFGLFPAAYDKTMDMYLVCLPHPDSTLEK